MSDIRERFASEVGPGGLEARGYSNDVRAETEQGPTIAGIGSPYEKASRIQGFGEDWDEVVARGAWRNTISRDNVDIVSTFNHDVNHLLARTSNGTLNLSESADGLVYEAAVNEDDPNAVGVHARVLRGDITGSSVWFRVVKDQWEEPTEDNGLEVAKRTILEAELFEVGPVVFPAFPQTTAVAFRGLGVPRVALETMRGALTAAGVTRNSTLAHHAYKFSADPDRIVDDLRALFARSPDLHDKVCTVRAAAETAPQPQDTKSLANSELLYRIAAGTTR